MDREIVWIFGEIDKDGKLDMKDAINAAVASHQKAFFASRCDPQCIRAQLEACYDTFIDCKKLKLSIKMEILLNLIQVVQMHKRL